MPHRSRLPGAKMFKGDPLHSAKYTLEHAIRRIAEFEREAFAFRDSKPCVSLEEIDPETLERIKKVKLVKPIRNWGQDPVGHKQTL